MISQVATLQELETYYSVIDLLDVNDALDAQAEAERRSQKQTRS